MKVSTFANCKTLMFEYTTPRKPQAAGIKRRLCCVLSLCNVIVVDPAELQTATKTAEVINCSQSMKFGAVTASIAILFISSKLEEQNAYNKTATVIGEQNDATNSANDFAFFALMILVD